MYFSSLKASHENNQQNRIENKQRIVLSEHAVATLLSDLDVFHGSDQSYTSVKNISSADLNRIFECFRSSASVSVAAQLRKEEIRLNRILEGIDLPIRRSVIASMLKELRTDLQEQVEKLLQPKGASFTFRVNSTNLRYLLSDDGQAEASAYDDNIGQYFRAVFEEYCTRRYFEREGYYYQKEIQRITAAVTNKKLLKITLRSTHMEDGVPRHNIQYVKPIQLTENASDLYHYLVGSMASSREGPWKIGSIRLTSMLDFDILEQSVTWHSQLSQEISAAVREKGIQFLSDDQSPITVVVQFTARGERMYRSMLHLRPHYVKKEENRIYTFQCSFAQARSYFFKFGKEVRILSPGELIRNFEWGYLEAASQYRESD